MTSHKMTNYIFLFTNSHSTHKRFVRIECMLICLFYSSNTIWVTKFSSCTHSDYISNRVSKNYFNRHCGKNEFTANKREFYDL